jgi:hypothetical protein
VQHHAANMSVDETAHHTISSYFIGPQAENLDDFQANINVILEELRNRRLAFYGDDEVRSLFVLFEVTLL